MDTEVVKNYIQRNVRTVSGLGSLASELQISQDKLRKEFRRDVGMPISRFIRMAKIEKAKHLLKETDKYCFEICFEVGFPREDGGSRTFKQVTGMTMQEYRAAAKRGKRGDY